VIAAAEVVTTPIPPVGKLTTLAQVRREMVKVYKAARQGTLETQEGSRLVFMLTAIGRLIESSDFERRIEAVEKQLDSWRKESETNTL
jgi:hypothetical protein